MASFYLLRQTRSLPPAFVQAAAAEAAVSARSAGEDRALALNAQLRERLARAEGPPRFNGNVVFFVQSSKQRSAELLHHAIISFFRIR